MDLVPRLFDRYPEALVDAPLALVACDLDRADLSCIGYVGTAISLEVEPLNVHDSDLANALWQQAYFGAYQVWDRECLVSWQSAYFYVASCLNLQVDQLLDLLGEVSCHLFQLEVHPGGERLHVAAGDVGAEISPHNTA